jgi:hypothetical protein
MAGERAPGLTGMRLWAQETAWALWREKSLDLAQNGILAIQLVAIPTMLSQLLHDEDDDDDDEKNRLYITENTPHFQ